MILFQFFQPQLEKFVVKPEESLRCQGIRIVQFLQWRQAGNELDIIEMMLKIEFK